jgi:hypothetical protein
MKLQRANNVVVRAETPSQFKVFRKKVESTRSPMLKDTVNKLTFIATTEVKFISDTLNELDQIHKGLFEKQWGKKGKEDGIVSSIVDEGDDENIFLKK